MGNMFDWTGKTASDQNVLMLHESVHGIQRSGRNRYLEKSSCLSSALIPPQPALDGEKVKGEISRQGKREV